MMAADDDTKWWINTGLIALSLVLVLLTLYNRFSGRPLDNVAMNSKRWTSERVRLGLQTFTSEGSQLHLSERDFIELEENAMRYRTAYHHINSGKISTYECPWGMECPAKTTTPKTTMTALQHINYAYNVTRDKILQRAKERPISVTAPTDAALSYAPLSTQVVMC